MAVFSAIASVTLFAANVLGLSFAAASTFGLIAVGGAVLALGAAAAGAMTQQSPSMRTPQAQAVINQSAGARVRGYGRALLGGTRAFWDSRSGDLYQIIMMHSGEIDAIEHVRVGDIVADLDSNGDATNSALSRGNNRKVRIRQHLGTDDQAADQMMVNNWSQWTSDHRLRGIANLAVRFRSPRAEDYQRIFPDGYNTPVRGQCRLSKVYDPRNPGHDPDDGATWEWSDNASLAILDYLTHPDGFRRSIDDIDLPSFAAFADLCDEGVPLAAGGTEPRYRLWGVYSLEDQPQPILNQMRRACDAEFYQTPEGKIAIRGGAWEAPTVTIGPDAILGHAIEQGNSRFSEFNELKIMYTSPGHDFQTMEATAWIDLADQAERGPIPSQLDLDFVPSPSQARRLAKIHIAKSNPRWKGKVRCNASALNAMGERVVQIIIPELEINEAFFISKFEIAPDLSAVELEVMTISEAAYQWSPEEEGENPAIPQETSPDLEFPVPENLTLTEPDPGVIRAEVDDPDRDGLTLHAQIREGAGSIWNDMDIQDDNLSALFGEVGPGTYEVRARWLGPQNTAGAWTFPLAEITIT